LIGDLVCFIVTVFLAGGVEVLGLDGLMEHFNLHYMISVTRALRTSKTDMNRRPLPTLMLIPFFSAPVYIL
jgi:hypothetical protein